MRLITWNIQWCRGMDGKVDPARIARVARDMCDPDVCCFQEVAVNYPDLDATHDQPALLAAAFPGYSAHFAVAVDTPGDSRRTAGGRQQFGNMILSRLPVRQVFRHSLPWPPEAGVPNMPRVALEAAIEASWGLVSVVTTHLEYYAATQRAAQVERLIELQSERELHASTASAYRAGPFEPYPRPAASILTGDFNMRPEDALITRLSEVWRDAWAVANPGKPHAPTFCLYDNSFSKAPYCCDFVFVSENLKTRIASMRIDADTRASDHQPVIVELLPG